ncbi:hypothetical protein [Nonomuraea wenchangensis]|uniref:hypothetical protein n=2 Tax=Nonomuraea wenchangensis TaxID=568860 RepID=UPI0033CDE9F5
MNDGVPLERPARRLEEVVGELRGLPVAVERLEDSAVVRDRIAQAARAARELRAMHPVGSQDTGRQERRSRRDVLDALEGGVSMRTIVHASVLDDPVKSARIRQLHAAGDLHRVVDEPIQQVLIFDRAVAFVRLTPVPMAGTAAVGWVPFVSGVLSGVTLLAGAVAVGWRTMASAAGTAA